MVRNMYCWHLSVNKRSVQLHCVSRNVYILQKMIHRPSNVKLELMFMVFISIAGLLSLYCKNTFCDTTKYLFFLWWLHMVCLLWGFCLCKPRKVLASYLRGGSPCRMCSVGSLFWTLNCKAIAGWLVTPLTYLDGSWCINFRFCMLFDFCKIIFLIVCAHCALPKAKCTPHTSYKCSYSCVLMELWFWSLCPCVVSTVCHLLHPVVIYLRFCLWVSFWLI